MKKIYTLMVLVSMAGLLQAQTAEEVIEKVKAKLGKVNDYEAKGKMKTNVIFIKAPDCQRKSIL